MYLSKDVRYMEARGAYDYISPRRVSKYLHESIRKYSATLTVDCKRPIAKLGEHATIHDRGTCNADTAKLEGHATITWFPLDVCRGCIADLHESAKPGEDGRRSRPL